MNDGIENEMEERRVRFEDFEFRGMDNAISSLDDKDEDIGVERAKGICQSNVKQSGEVFEVKTRNKFGFASLRKDAQRSRMCKGEQRGKLFERKRRRKSSGVDENENREELPVRNLDVFQDIGVGKDL